MVRRAERPPVRQRPPTISPATDAIRPPSLTAILVLPGARRERDGKLMADDGSPFALGLQKAIQKCR